MLFTAGFGTVAGLVALAEMAVAELLHCHTDLAVLVAGNGLEVARVAETVVAVVLVVETVAVADSMQVVAKCQ